MPWFVGPNGVVRDAPQDLLKRHPVNPLLCQQLMRRRNRLNTIGGLLQELMSLQIFYTPYLEPNQGNNRLEVIFNSLDLQSKRNSRG